MATRSITRSAAQALRLPRPEGAWVQREEAIMGTAIRVELWCEQRSRGEAAAAAVLDEMHRIDRAMSPHHAGSELCRINRAAAQRAVPLSAEMFGLIEQALHWSRFSEGAFDITVNLTADTGQAALGSNAGPNAGSHIARRQLHRPGAALPAPTGSRGRWQNLLLDPATRTLRFAREGLRIDLDGYAQGHAVDRCAALLRERGVAQAMVSAGGSSRVIGSRPPAGGSKPWNVALTHPRRPGEVVAVLPLQDTALSTWRGHGCDNDTGMASVTVLAPDGLTSAALSQAVFALGPARGLALIEGLPAAAALIVDTMGQLHASSALPSQPGARPA